MGTLKLIKKLEKKGYPLWKIHEILTIFDVALKPVIDVADFAALAASISYQQGLHDAELYIERLDDWDKNKKHEDK